MKLASLTNEVYRHCLSVGSPTNCRLAKEKQIGTATYEDNSSSPFFCLRFWHLNGLEYYLIKNKNNANYTVFANKEETILERPIFRCPIGAGRNSSENKDFIEINLNFPRQRCFLNIHPIN